MKLIVCGGRDYDNWPFVCSVLDKVHAKKPITFLFEGGAKGADSHAAIWAERNLVPRVTFHANWEGYGKRAGPLRNSHMIQMGAEGVLAFPGGIGTADMINQAEKSGLKVMEVSDAR